MPRSAVTILPHDVVSILDIDPELGEGLAPDEFGVAAEALRAGCVSVPAGRWDPSALAGANPPALGLLILEGLMTREVVVAGRPGTELLGATDLLRPWDRESEAALLPIAVEWVVLQPARVAVLDARFERVALRWPSLVEALLSRALRRARWLSFLLATKQIARVEGRLVALLWAMSERWGKVTPAGVRVELGLTHEQLGRLVGARRPSVTTAIGALCTAGLLDRTDDGYVLLGEVDDAMRYARSDRVLG